MEIDIEFDKEIMKKVTMIDEILISIEQPPVFLNEYITIGQGYIWESHLAFNLSRPGAVAFHFDIFMDGLEIRIDDHDEALCYDEEHFKNIRESIVYKIETILTKKCRIVRKGKRRMIIYFLDEDGNFLISFKYWTNTILNEEEGTFEYPPFFDKK